MEPSYLNLTLMALVLIRGGILNVIGPDSDTVTIQLQGSSNKLILCLRSRKFCIFIQFTLLCYNGTQF